jgi:hypothetical protein
MIRTASWAHLSQMYTRGPATSFATSVSVRRQNEQRSLLKNIVHLASITVRLKPDTTTENGHHNASVTRADAATFSGSGVKSSPGLMKRSFSKRYCLS